MQSGSVLASKYRLVSLLGSGGMGSVWRAEHLGLKAPVAIKLLAPELDGRQDAIARFLREAQSAASLRSPHVVQVFDHGLDETTRTPFIAMELMDGESLAERLARVTRLSPAETSKLMTQAARALTRAQELGIVHRDLKPANLFLVRNEDDEILKVLDFGLAKWRRPPGGFTQGAATATNLVMGTPYYMSPEQMSDSRDVDQRSDLWALGVIAFECLTGTRPFDGDTLVSIALKICNAPTPALHPIWDLPAELEAWFARALAKDPALRFQTARELADQLKRACHVDSSSVSGQAPALGSAPSGASQPAPQHEARAAGQTAALPRVAPSEQASPEPARSAQPVARSVGSEPAPVQSSRRRSHLAWAFAAALALAALASLVGIRNRLLPTASLAPSQSPPPLHLATSQTETPVPSPEPPSSGPTDPAPSVVVLPTGPVELAPAPASSSVQPRPVRIAPARKAAPLERPSLDIERKPSF